LQSRLFKANRSFIKWVKMAEKEYPPPNELKELFACLKGHCLIFLSAIYQLFSEYFNIK